MTKIKEKVKWAKPNIKWIVWFFPVVAIGISAALALDFLRERGPMIRIQFPEAANVEAEKTTVQYRGIVVGKVVRVELSDDAKNVTVFVRLTRNAKKLSVEGSKYWIVQPEVGFEGVRGLDTIFKGPYIRVEPGNFGGNFRDHFVGFIGTGHRGRALTIKLQSVLVDSIDVNDPVTFRGLKVGTVKRVELNKSGRFIDVRLSLDGKYEHLIRQNTHFWRKSGVQADVSLFGGAKVNIGSLETLMKGGVAFATPTKAGPKITPDSVFELLNEAPKDWMKWSPDL